jgi:hypothetical protein
MAAGVKSVPDDLPDRGNDVLVPTPATSDVQSIAKKTKTLVEKSLEGNLVNSLPISI